jgi:hypothetical protein
LSCDDTAAVVAAAVVEADVAISPSRSPFELSSNLLARRKQFPAVAFPFSRLSEYCIPIHTIARSSGSGVVSSLKVGWWMKGKNAAAWAKKRERPDEMSSGAGVGAEAEGGEGPVSYSN